MRKSCIGLCVVVAVLVVSSGLQAQTPAGPGSGAAQGTPDLSGVWEGLGGMPRTAENALCGIQNVCATLLGLKVEPSPDTREEPEMLPWAEEQYKKLRASAPSPTANPPQALNPSWSGCLSEGPVQILQPRFNRWEIRQFPDVVLFFFSTDHEVRRVYVDGRGHPANLKPTWMGHSIGRYEGDTLVIDTVGIKDNAWLTAQGHPHSDALRLEERIRRVQPERLEIEVTIDDPKTYKKPWKMKFLKGLLEPGPQFWDTSECEELFRMGTHFSAESPAGSPQQQPAPATPY